MSDAPAADRLIRVAAQGRAVYAGALSRLFGTRPRILGTRSGAEDALQEVFTRVWLNARRFDAGGGMTWLIAIARTHAIDRLRARPAARASEHEEAEDRPVEAAPGGREPADRAGRGGVSPERAKRQPRAPRVRRCFL